MSVAVDVRVDALMLDLTDKELKRLGEAVRAAIGESGFGRDPARMTKAAKIAYIAALAPSAVIMRALADFRPTSVVVVDAMPAAPPTPNVAMQLPVAVPPTPPMFAKENPASPIHSNGAVNGAAPDASAALANAVRAIAGGAVNEMRVREIVAEEVMRAVTEAAPQRVELIVGDMPAVSLEGRHPRFAEVLALCALPKALRVPVLLVGPAGCGKSTLAHHVALALDRQYGSISLSEGVTEAALTGRVLPIHEHGRFGHVDSEFLRCYTSPSVYLLDELDAADPNVLLVINQAVANGGFHVETRAVDGHETWVPWHDDSVILGAANTYGTGATAQYVGRSAIDAATLDRFIIMYLEYDARVESAIMGAPLPTLAPWMPHAYSEDARTKTLLRLHTWIGNVRRAATEHGLQRVVSTRAYLKARTMVAAGFQEGEIMRTLLAGWRDDELAALGLYAPKAETVDPYDIANSDWAESWDDEAVLCPKCSGPMCVRKAKHGRNAGKSFYGCVGYPECNGTRKMPV